MYTKIFLLFFSLIPTLTVLATSKRAYKPNNDQDSHPQGNASLSHAGNVTADHHNHVVLVAGCSNVNISSLYKDPKDEWGTHVFPPDVKPGARFPFAFKGTYSVEAFSVSLWASPADKQASTLASDPTAKLSVSFP